MIRPLPVDGTAVGEGQPATILESSSRSLQCRLDTLETEDLIHRAPQRLRATRREILLTALSAAIRSWSGAEAALIDLEGHGRNGPEDLFDAIGWFTSRAPLLLTGPTEKPSETSGWVEALAVTKTEFRSMPGERPRLCSGTSICILPPRSAEVWSPCPRPAVAFNYLGRLDAVLSDSEIFESEVRALPRERHGDNPMVYQPRGQRVGGPGAPGGLLVLQRGGAFGERPWRPWWASFLEGLRALLALPTVLRPADLPLCSISSQELETLAVACGGAEQVEDVLPLGGAQEGMLLYLLVRDDESARQTWSAAVDGQTEADPVFFNQLHCELRGPLEAAVLQQVLREALVRHPILRTSFHWLGLTAPVQVVRPAVELPWRELDWSRSTEDPEAQLEALLEEDRGRGFRLERAPLLRWTLIRLSPKRHRLLLSYHHLILDGWSVARLLREVFGAYEARATRQARQIPGVPAGESFRDYLAWQRAQDREPAERFWRQRLAGLGGASRPFGDRGPAASNGRFRQHERDLGERLTEKLRARARDLRVTLSSIIQGAWALVLHEATQSREVVLGTVVSGREGGFETALGLFINALPLRAAVDREGPVEGWLQAVQAAQVEAREYGYCALEEIHQWCPEAGQERLFESLVIFENYPVEGSLLEGRAGLEVCNLEVVERTNYPLALFALPGDSLRLELGTDAGRFDAVTGEILVARCERLLIRLGEDRCRTVGELLAPDEGERQQVLYGWNPALSSPPEILSVEAAFSQQASKDPAAPALLVPASDGSLESITYGRLHRRVSRLAEELEALGAGTEVVIALRFDRSPEQLTALLAVLSSGGAFLPLDLSWPPSRCRQVLAEAGAHLLLTDRSLDAGDALGEIPTYFLDGEGTLSAARPAQLLLRSPGGRRTPGREDSTRLDSLAYVLYTSGSTGRPKGVEVSRRALGAHCRWAAEAFSLSPRDRVLQLAALAFDASLEEIFPALARGAALVLRTDAMLASARSFWQACDRWGVTVADLPTVLWHGLAADSEAPSSLPRSLRLVVLGGERARPRAALEWKLRYGQRTRLLNTYGPTEAAVVASSAEVLAQDHQIPAGALPEVPLGRAISHARIYVLDRRGRPQPAGVCGELAISGEGLARGYRGRPGATARRFVPDPYSGRRGSRMLLTGDLGRWNLEGDLEFLGRRDRQIKIRGIRIEPGEIEAVLESHPRVREAYVVSSPGRCRLAAGLLRPDDGHRRGAHGSPAAPSAGVDGAFDADRPGRVAARAFREGGPGSPVADRRPREGPPVAPSPPATKRRRAVAQIFEEVLGVEGVGALDNFFDLGGHSLLATRLVAAVKELFEVDLPLRLVFEAPTVEAFGYRRGER